jgi:hypothetical protein
MYLLYRNADMKNNRPHREHTEIEEELHETAHIDYDRVAIVANPSVAARMNAPCTLPTSISLTLAPIHSQSTKMH